MRTIVGMTQANIAFLEHTILTIFLWIGIWGIVTLLFEHYIKSFGYQLATYIFFVIASFSLLNYRNHIKG